MAPRILWLGPCTLQRLLPLCSPRAPAAILQASASLSSGSRLRTASSESCPRTHLVLTPSCTLVFLLTPPPPFTALPRSSVLPPQLPLLFPFSLGPFWSSSTHASSSHPPPQIVPSDLPQMVDHIFLHLFTLFLLRPHRFSQSLVITLRVLAPDCVLGLCSLPVPQLFLPCLFLLQIVFSLLLATHQLHPHHLSKSFAYSLLITFPSFQQGSLVPRAGICCFRVSHTAVMRIVFPQVVFGVPAFTPFSLCILHVLFPWALSFKSLGLLFLTVSAFQPSPWALPTKGNTTVSSHSIITTCCWVLSQVSLHRRPCLSSYAATQTMPPACLSAPGSVTFHSIILLACSLLISLPHLPYCAS